MRPGPRLRSTLATLALIAAPAVGLAQMPAPSREAIPVPSQPGAVALPVAPGTPEREVWHLDNGAIAVRNVTRPTLTPFLPVGKGTGTAMIIAPGGGFLGLAIEREGWDIARYLANHGVAAFVLKYRVLPTPAPQPEFADALGRLLSGGNAGFSMPDDTPAEAYADGLAALREVRSHAAAYGVDPAKVGFMGFSAGGFLTRTLLERAGAERPAFAAPIYPNMAAISVTADAPPLFVVIGTRDFLLKRVTGFPLVEAWQAAGRPVEFHLLDGVDHGFGPGHPGTHTAGWLDLLARWLDARGLLKEHP